jgi:hypothetical protein
MKISAKESLGYCELKKHKLWFDEGCSKLLGQRKQAKLQWLQDPSEINRDNLNNVRREASRYFKNKKREYLKDKINELAMNSKDKVMGIFIPSMQLHYHRLILLLNTTYTATCFGRMTIFRHYSTDNGSVLRI